MTLILELSARRGAAPGAPAHHVFDEAGGTIGRDGKNSWVLADGEVSGRHAQISYRNGSFYIEDTNSTNGVSINSLENRLVPSRRYPLTSGDRIFIASHVITVTIAAAADQAVRPLDSGMAIPASERGGRAADSNPFLTDDPFAEGDAPLARQSPFPTPAAADSAEELNPLNLLGGAPKPRAKQPAADPGRPPAGSLLESHYRPPDVVRTKPDVPPVPELLPAHELVPHDYDPLRDDSMIAPADELFPSVNPAAPPFESVQAPPPPPAPAPRPEPTATMPMLVDVRPADEPAPPVSGAVRMSLDVQALLEGAGVEGSLAAADLEQTFGQILRVVVDGVMEVLRARQEIKDEFRMHLTQFRPTENNPLKFSANVEDALHNLLVKRNPAYLGPVESFAEAFQDLRHHQIAMLAGMRAAFDAMLDEFEPDRLQNEFDRHIKTGALLSVPAKLRYWDSYRDRLRELVQDKDATFRKLFGEEFAEAYEAQLRRLKEAGGRGPLPAAARGKQE
ncbi:MAG TPA: type VI secretion system-associated FHA domain protein TagH [Candidatus Polarisedimenticolia bacterium]|nr:type VI secretion system-associated FHA domain protein TagH [Candidatus Polarisedimenticolia bacterium]